MDDRRLRKYHRAYGYDLNALMLRFLAADNDLRYLLDWSPYCAPVTLLTCVFAVLVLICSIASFRAVTSNEIVFRRLKAEADEKAPRRESVISIRPTYNCVHKHLRQTGVFQGKAKKTLCKERLELEIMNSRISCINKLLKPEAQSEWRSTRSPKIYYRAINTAITK